jgi:hypothetical protein
VDINRFWETIRENINISAQELKKYKPWFDEGYPKLVHQRKQAKLQWLQDPSKINGDNLNIRCETSRHFTNKKREYLRDKIDELAVNSKNKSIEISIEENRGCQHRSNLVKDENGDLLSDSQNIYNRWKYYFSRLLNVHRVSDLRQIGIHTAESLVQDPSPFEVEIAIAKLRRYKSPGSVQIPAELIEAEG